MKVVLYGVTLVIIIFTYENILKVSICQDEQDDDAMKNFVFMLLIFVY